MPIHDPAALSIAIGLVAGLFGVLPARRGRRAAGMLVAAGAGAALADAAALAHVAALAEPSAVALAAAAAALTAFALPGLGLQRFRRRSFGGDFGWAAFAGAQGEARFRPRAGAALRPNRLLDGADRLRLERCVYVAEEKTAAQLAVAIAASARAHEGAPWRAACWTAALALAVWAALAAEPARLAPLFVAAVAATLGRALGASARVRRFCSSERALSEAAAEGAFDAFARAGLAARERAGALVYAALFEARVLVLTDPVLDRAAAAAPAWKEIAAETARAIAAGHAADGLAAAVEAIGAIGARALPAVGPQLPGGRPGVIRLDD